MTVMNRTAPASTGAHTAGWITSLILHGTLAVGAFIFAQQIRLAPEPPPFKWNVAMVTPEQQSMLAPSPASSPDHAPSATKQPTPTAQPHTQSVQPVSPSRPEPVKVEPVQPPTPIVSSSVPPSQPEQQPAVMKPAPPLQTVTAHPTPTIQSPLVPDVPAPSATIEKMNPVPQERTATRPVDPAPEPTSTETAPTTARQEAIRHVEASPATHETFAPAPTPSAVSEPAVAETSNPSVTRNPTSEAVSTSAPQVAALAPSPSAAPARLDYGWLSDTILRRVEELKRYPAEARLDRAEGKVVLKAVIRADGSVDDVEVYQSSGYRSLDQAAIELMKRAAPFQLPRPLGKAKMTVKIPMSYRLEQ